MCKLSARYYIALLTFLIGVSSVSVWFLCRNSKVAQLAETSPSQSVTNDRETSRPLDDGAENSEKPHDWRISSVFSNAVTAGVSSFGNAPNSKVFTTLTIQCPKENSDFNALSIMVDSSEETGVDLYYFEGPGAPSYKRALGEIRAVSPKKKLTIKTEVGGWYSYGGFVFGLPSEKLAPLIAKGSTEITIIIHDYNDYKKTIQATFPAIDPASETARTLKGCRK